VATTRPVGPCRQCGGPVPHCEFCGEEATKRLCGDELPDGADLCDACDASLDDEARALAGGE
jgi:hypothetical protein